MTEHLDIRLNNDWVVREFGEGLGEALYSFRVDPSTEPDEFSKEMMRRSAVRRVLIRTDDPLFPELKRRILEAEAKPGARYVASAVLLRRRYGKRELDACAFIQIKFHLGFKRSAEEWGTLYDDRLTCEKCGHSRVRLSPLRLNFSKATKRAHVARTIGNELVVSEEFANTMRASRMSGFDLAPAQNVGRGPADRQWHELKVTGRAGRTHPPTRFGNDYIRDKVDERYTCRIHGLVGLNLLSEVHLRMDEMDGSDVMATADRYGIYGGWVTPTPVFIVTQRFYGLIRAAGVKGFSAEAAHTT